MFSVSLGDSLACIYPWLLLNGVNWAVFSRSRWFVSFNNVGRASTAIHGRCCWMSRFVSSVTYTAFSNLNIYDHQLNLHVIYKLLIEATTCNLVRNEDIFRYTESNTSLCTFEQVTRFCHSTIAPKSKALQIKSPRDRVISLHDPQSHHKQLKPKQRPRWKHVSFPISSFSSNTRPFPY